MTEREWLESSDPRAMLSFLQAGGRASERKLRLLGAACCRRLGDLLKEGRCLEAVEAIERFADGMSSTAALKRARQAVRAVRYGLSAEEAPRWEACWITEVATTTKAYAQAPMELLRLSRQRLEEEGSVRVLLSNLVRELFGNPFRPLPPLPTWHDGLVVRLAQAAYEERLLPSGHLDPARLAVLADALLDAGCTEAALLGHLRGDGPHCRGCFAVDVLLGKA
jgi:hypothetical protein